MWFQLSGLLSYRPDTALATPPMLLFIPPFTHGVPSLPHAASCFLIAQEPDRDLRHDGGGGGGPYSNGGGK